MREINDMNHISCSECGCSFDNGPGSVPPNPLCEECDDYERAMYEMAGETEERKVELMWGQADWK